MSALYEFKPKKHAKSKAGLIETIRTMLDKHGRTEREAANFADRAMVLMAENGITLEEVKTEKEKPTPDDDDEVVSSPGNPMPNVRRFLAAEYAHPEHCLLLHQGGQFYRWDGTCWPAVEDPILRSRLYKWFENKSVQVGDKLVPFAPNQSKVTNLMDAARAITVIETTKETPSWLRSAWSTDQSILPADEMISCENGLIHWPTRAMSAHRPTYYAHHSVPFAFDPSAPAPARWLSFLAELWPDDQSSIDTLQEMFGYLVSGDTRQQKMFMLVGPKRGGKGTIARVLEKMIGKHNVGGSTLASLGTNFGLQDLIGKPVCVISDARIGDKSDGSIITERLLSISGEDLLNVDRKYLAPWSGYLPTRIVILTNQLPRFTDASGALASRFILLRLSVSFYGRENPALTRELCEELPGIFNWSLDGLQTLRERGRFEQPVASADAMREMEDLASPIGAFIRDRCVLGRGELVEVEVLYKIYGQWCLDNGHKARSVQTFGTELRAARPEIKIERPRVGGERVRRYIGVGMMRADRTADHADQGDGGDEVVRVVRDPEQRHAAEGDGDDSDSGTPHHEYGNDQFRVRLQPKMARSK